MSCSLMEQWQTSYSSSLRRVLVSHIRTQLQTCTLQAIRELVSSNSVFSSNLRGNIITGLHQDRITIFQYL